MYIPLEGKEEASEFLLTEEILSELLLLLIDSGEIRLPRAANI